jgi:hypothetical protein
MNKVYSAEIDILPQTLKKLSVILTIKYVYQTYEIDACCSLNLQKSSFNFTRELDIRIPGGYNLKMFCQNMNFISKAQIQSVEPYACLAGVEKISYFLGPQENIEIFM